ncbi:MULTISPECIES: pentapeptide repeat-containing protein [Okeania]|uniref:Pentapeptide repeat-containing protein n=1 Tax=Okeania hirsuta TaxID=1458930 RepID=A0A3N6R5F2_9CYAN|nr:MULTISPECIES: pentapeptide repeat-containing protein [Okeania]NET12681.1 hypothetical protein [Okeania sp. SIO1H6]NES78699.1 hypothetical protein [Okeania sp. SIO1H4]NES92121.1 hypothetical protein [Okeania sp. SIO2B9]NET22172.1 hypothetical protein [Okeania sp. SIO1H5]NET79080.1 hypothetical protein [Okeania sp. SIO1F9]
MSKQHWLDISEYVCLAGSVLGTIASVTSGQAIYTAAPLTLALSASVANRKRLDKLQQQEQRVALTDIQKTFLEDVDRVDSQTFKLQEKLNLQTEDQEKKLEVITEQLNQKLVAERETLEQQTQQQRHKLQEAIESIPTELQQLIQRLEPLERQQKEIISQRLPWAVSAIEELQDRAAAIAPLESKFGHISRNLQILNNRVESLPQPEFFGKIETAITSVQKRLDLNPVNFQGAVLTDADFSGIYLKNAKLIDANLSGINLGGACLNNANLTDVNLSNANLIGADLAVANLAYANLNHAELGQVDLSGANLSGVDLSSANLSGVNLSSANLTDADLSNANLSGANLTHANLSGVILSDADLSNANLTNANLSHAGLNNTNLSHANLCAAQLWCADISDADLTGTFIDQNTKLDKETQEKLQRASHKTKNQNLRSYGTKVTNINHNGVHLMGPNFLEGKSNDSIVQPSIIDTK